MENSNMRNDIKIEVFIEGDEKEILRLLSQADLPAKDLTLDKLKNFLVAKGIGGSVIGTIGVEAYHDIGLLRSLVVDASHRGKGLGKQLV
jgi:amino-acid N-acetyltransferase